MKIQQKVLKHKYFVTLIISIVVLSVIIFGVYQLFYNVQDMKWEDIKQLNGGEMPPMKFYKNGDLKRISGKYTDMKVD